MIEVPLKKCSELDGDQKKLMITMIRMLCKDLCNISHLGLEATEEALTELIDKGLAKIAWDEDQGIFGLMHYDFKTESYIIGKGE